MSEKIFKNKTAKDLFPALFPEINDDNLTETENTDYQQPITFSVRNTPPPPQNVDWSRTAVIDSKSEKEAHIPRALLVTNDLENLSLYSSVLQSLGYAVEHAQTESGAINLVSSISYLLILYEDILALQQFEQYMRNLSGGKRRNIFYIIIGPKLKTLYDLEALCLSANLVINSNDIKYLELILKKGFKDYETLYGPFLETLDSVKGSRYS